MSDIPTIAYGRVLAPRSFVEERLRVLADKAGGRASLQRILTRCDAAPRRALELAIRRSRFENILASVGESLVGIAVLVGAFWLLDGRSAAPGDLALELYTPACAALALHIWIQRSLSLSWYESRLRPALERAAKAEAIAAALSFYREVTARMTLSGTILYPLTTALTLALVAATPTAWMVILPTSVLAGWMVNRVLFYTRLLHADPSRWFDAFGLELSAEDELAFREARRGTGAWRRIWARVEARGYADLSRFEVYILAQCACGLIAAIALLVALVLVEPWWQRLMITVPLVLGLSAVSCSYFMRFAFVNRRAGRSHEPAPLPASAGLSQDLDVLARHTIDARSRAFRRAMP